MTNYEPTPRSPIVRYADDPRVTPIGDDGYTVLRDGHPKLTLLHSGVFGYSFYSGPDLDAVMPGVGFDTPDAALDALFAS